MTMQNKAAAEIIKQRAFYYLRHRLCECFRTQNYTLQVKTLAKA